MKKLNILPPIYLYVFILLSLILHNFLPLLIIVPESFKALGFAFILFGITLNYQADQLFKKHQTTVHPHEKPTTLITSWPFSLSRHPMYLGFLSVLLGLAFILASLSSFIPVFVMFYILETKFILQEERNLEEVFSDKYKEYKKKVRKWL